MGLRWDAEAEHISVIPAGIPSSYLLAENSDQRGVGKFIEKSIESDHLYRNRVVDTGFAADRRRRCSLGNAGKSNVQRSLRQEVHR